MKNVRTILLVSGCLGGLLLQIGCDIHLGCWSQAQYERMVERQAPLAEGSTLAVETSYGSVKTERPITIRGNVSKKKLNGAIGQGTGKLHLETGSGSISLI